MKPTPRATVIEFFFPGGFAYDYEFTVSIHVALLSASAKDRLSLLVSRAGCYTLWLLGWRVSDFLRVSAFEDLRSSSNRYFTHPDTPKVAYPEGFQGNEIPIGKPFYTRS